MSSVSPHALSESVKQMEDSWSETQTRQTSIENTLSSMQEETVKVRNFGEELEQRLEKRRASLNQNLTDLQKRQEEEKQSLDQFVKETTAFRQEAENALSSLKKDVGKNVHKKSVKRVSRCGRAAGQGTG